MHTSDTPPPFRDRDPAAPPVTRFDCAEDVLQAMLQAIEGGELHLRPKLDADTPAALQAYLDVGTALRTCCLDERRHTELIERLRPHRKLIIGAWPAGLQLHGLLPQPSAVLRATPGYRDLRDLGDVELRQWLIDDGRLIYGEFKPCELDNYFDAVTPFLRPGGSMVDLGSGLGRVVMSAALKLPFARCTGVELLGYRHRMALERLETLLARGDEAWAALPSVPGPDELLRLPSGVQTDTRHLLALRERIRFIEQDMFDADVSDASLVFVYSTCFAPLMDALGDKLARELPQHALVSTTTYPLKHPAFKLLREFPSQTLAWTTVFLYERLGALDALPPAEASCLYEPSASDWEKEAREVLRR